MKTIEEINKKFGEEFVYDTFDNTGLSILGNRKLNKPATDEDVMKFYTQQIMVLIEELEGKKKIDKNFEVGYKKGFKAGLKVENKRIIKLINKFKK